MVGVCKGGMGIAEFSLHIAAVHATAALQPAEAGAEAGAIVQRHLLDGPVDLAEVVVAVNAGDLAAAGRHDAGLVAKAGSEAMKANGFSKFTANTDSGCHSNLEKRKRIIVFI